MSDSIEKRIAAQTEHLSREELVRLFTNYATELGDVKTILGEVLPLESSAEKYAIRAREEIAALRSAVVSIHGAVMDAGDIVLPETVLDHAADLARCVREIVAQRDEGRAQLAELVTVARAAERVMQAWVTLETAGDFAEPKLSWEAYQAALAALSDAAKEQITGVQR